MSGDKGFAVAAAAMLIAVVFLVLIIVAAELQRGRLVKYNDTITEYMMCVEYNPDCECSDIILSEYGEEAE